VVKNISTFSWSSYHGHDSPFSFFSLGFFWAGAGSGGGGGSPFVCVA
jgi:hypothetical protein